MKNAPVALRALALLPAALLLAPLLAACTTQAVPASADGCVAPGSASEAISVSGEFGAALELDAATPITSDALQRSVLQAGAGETIAAGDVFVGRLNIFVGSTGDPYAQDPTRMVFDTQELAPWYFDTIRCGHAGERIASVVPAVDMLGEGGGAPAGIADDDTMVVVVDLRAVLSAGSGQAEGAPQELPAGIPGLVLDADGAPAATLGPEVAAATEPAAAAAIVGTGARVRATDTVLVHSRTVIARTGEIVEDTWGTGPISLPLPEALPGLRDGIVGQTVGSRLVIVLPPGAGYTPTDLEALGYQANDVMVSVVDLLDAG